MNLDPFPNVFATHGGRREVRSSALVLRLPRDEGRDDPVRSVNMVFLNGIVIDGTALGNAFVRLPFLRRTRTISFLMSEATVSPLDLTREHKLDYLDRNCWDTPRYTF